MKKIWVVAIGAACAVVFFFVGMAYGKNGARSSAFARGMFGGNVAMNSSSARFARGGAGGGLVAGNVIAKDAESITVQLPNGNSEVVFYSTSTMITKPAPASVGDLASGTIVTVIGTQNSDGSLTAQSIQVRPAGTGNNPFGR